MKQSNGLAHPPSVRSEWPNTPDPRTDTPSQEVCPPQEPAPISPKSPNPDQKRKRSDETGDVAATGEKGSFRGKRQRTSREELGSSPQTTGAGEGDAERCDAGSTEVGPVHHWVQHGIWPRDLFERNGTLLRDPSEQDSNMSLPLTRKRSTPSISNAHSSTPTHREGKYPAARTRQYERLLATSGIYMNERDDEATSDASKALCKTLLETEQIVPQDSLFNDDLFMMICKKARNRNEARVIRDLSPLLVPSAEILYIRGVKALRHLIDYVDEGWIKSIPLVKGPQPRPDFSFGIRDTAFSPEQLKKLQPYIGGWATTSYLAASEEMYFPFLTCEVKCGNEAFDAADRQNAHSAGVAANAVVQLYRAVSRQDELHRQVLAFSISHDNEAVRIFGHYVLINGQQTSFYRHSIHKFDFTSLDGREKWTTYKFTRNVYDIFFPAHLERICAAIDQLPDPEAFNVRTLSQSTKQDNSHSTPLFSQEDMGPPSSQTTQPVFKKPRAKNVPK